MTTKSKLYHVITILVILMSIVACKTPQATMPKDTLKDSLPALSKDSSVTISPAWREFFQDPMLQKLIETALQNNQDLKITLQELAIARSAITAKQAALLPSVTANIGAGVSKVGRYTAEENSALSVGRSRQRSSMKYVSQSRLSMRKRCVRCPSSRRKQRSPCHTA